MRTHLYGLTTLPATQYGNPRYIMHTTDGKFTTSSDSAFVYSIHDGMNKDVTLELTRNGRVKNMHVERFFEEEFYSCIVCVHLIANGEYNDGTNAAEECLKRVLESDPQGFKDMHVVGEHEEFRSSSCDTCGDWHHGDRMRVIRLTPQ